MTEQRDRESLAAQQLSAVAPAPRPARLTLEIAERVAHRGVV